MHGAYCVISNSCSPMDCSPQGSSVLGFSRQEYWSGLSFPPPGDLPNPGIKLWSPALQADALPPKPPGKQLVVLIKQVNVKLFEQHLGHGIS